MITGLAVAALSLVVLSLPRLPAEAAFPIGKLCRSSCGIAIQQCVESGHPGCRRDMLRRCKQEGVQVCAACLQSTSTTLVLATSTTSTTSTTPVAAMTASTQPTSLGTTTTSSPGSPDFASFDAGPIRVPGCGPCAGVLAPPITIGHLDVRTGQYVVQVTASISNPNSVVVEGDCVIQTAADIADSGTLTVQPMGAAVLAVSGTAAVDADTATISVVCRNLSGPDAGALFAQSVAMTARRAAR